MFQLVCQQAEKGQHLPEGDAAHCSCCSPAVRVLLLLLSTVRSTKENNSCFIYTYICVLVCVCVVPFARAISLLSPTLIGFFPLRWVR